MTDRPSPDWLRPATAAARFDVSKRTLGRWAEAGLIGRSQIERTVWYRAADIADLIASHAAPRSVVPMRESLEPAGSDWRSDPFWQEAAR